MLRNTNSINLQFVVLVHNTTLVNNIMNSLIVILCLALASANAFPSLLLGGSATLIGPGNPGAILQGPGAKATVAGPDGSVIGAIANGGALLAAPQPGGVVSAAVAPGLIGLRVPAIAIAPLGGLGLKTW